MLTAKVGANIINCFDGTYDRYRLKQWSSKGILKCPVCGGDYEYCHGEVISPYFRHIGKECEGYYSESETDEHRNGKLLLYNWIKNQEGVTNCNLEYWIPETKQRPDIYFEYNNERFVIEFQCTPIASEFLIRRELYKLAGINDIWILGTEKYNIEIDKEGNPNYGKRSKFIEKELKNNLIIYLDVNRNILICNSLILQFDRKLKDAINKLRFEQDVKRFNLYYYYSRYNDFLFIQSLNDFIFDRCKLKLDKKIQKLLNCVNNYYIGQYEKIIQEDIIRDEKLKEMKIKAYEMKEKLYEVEKRSDYIGSIGENINTNVLVVDESYFRTYDSSLYKFIDENGNILAWMTSTRPNISIGDFIEINGKIKSHQEYEGVKQTRVIRCKVGLKVK